MGHAISAVIICRNEEHIIGRTIEAAATVADEIVVYDTGSTDRTMEIATQLGARLIRGPWEGYGICRQKAISAAGNDWILNIDSDEVIDAQLQQSIRQLRLDDPKKAYSVRFTNFLGSSSLNWGEFGFDAHVRLFNRQYVGWNDGTVHEKLIVPADVEVVRLRGRILHFTMKDTCEFVNKSVNYALINAEQYFSKGKKASWIKQFLAPPVMFLKYYILRLGFLDGWAGLFAARMAGLYTYLKYTRLRELWTQAGARR
ncbi:MAG TPA: glycosyltransferase family 2 protein [Flavisolibacter sp.]